MFFANTLCSVTLSSVGKIAVLASLLASSAVLAQQGSETATANNSETSPNSDVKEQQPIFAFPQWPVRTQATREVVPPPPPGPYMSSALSNSSGKTPSFASRTKKRVMDFDPSTMSMDSFSPDVPWPTNMREPSPSRWMPESGYSYVSPQSRMPANVQPQMPAAMTYSAPSGNSFGYRPNAGPMMNRSGMPYGQNPYNSGQNRPSNYGNAPMNWAPSMPNGQMRSYSNRPNTYRSNRAPSPMPSQGYPQ